MASTKHRDLPSKICLSPQEYAVQDAVLQTVSSGFITIKPADKKYFNYHLKFVIESLITRMKEESQLFKTMYSKERCAGSYWDKLKVGKPVEFDKSFILKLPSFVVKNLKIQNTAPAFVSLDVGEGLKLLKKNKAQWETYRRIEKWVDRDGMLLTNEIRSWMESVVDKALNGLEKDGDKSLLENKDKSIIYKLKTCKAGPAITIQVEIFSDRTKFDIDIVPAFEFGESKWPDQIRPCPPDCRGKNWHLVPKPIRRKGFNTVKNQLNTSWRLSFHEQESHIIFGTFHLKAVLKLLKKLRDVKEQYMLSSYAIKTVFMWEMEEQNSSDFWKKRLCFIFLHMLQVLTARLKSGKIPFYWDKNHDLLYQLTDIHKSQLYNTFSNVYHNIIWSLEGPLINRLVIAEELLNEEEFQRDKQYISNLITQIVKRGCDERTGKRRR